MSEATIRSREEDDVLQRSTKNESHRDLVGHELLCSNLDVEGRSYRDKLVGVCPGALEKAFDIESTIEMEAMTNDRVDEDCPGEATVRLTGNRKGKIQVAWKDALTVKVFGKIVGYYLVSLRKPVSKLECIDLGNDFFLIKFSIMED